MGLQLFRRLGAGSPFDPDHKLVTSPVCSPLVLAVIRLSLAFYSLFTAIFILVWEGVVLGTASSYFSYFTDLSYIGLCAYFWVSGFHTLVYVRRREKSYPLQNWPKALQALHQLLFSTVISYPFLVTIVFWSLLASSATFANGFDSWSNISHHAMNSGFALFEIIFTHAPPTPWFHLPFLVVILASYLGLAYVTYATQGFYTYSFLDPSKEHAKLAAYIVGIALAECIIFAITRSICAVREKICDRIRSRETSNSEAIDEWEEIDRSSAV